MNYNNEILGIESNTCVDIEVMDGGIVEILTDGPDNCCVAIVKLDENGLDELIASLIEAQNSISKKYKV
jgi:hypothetical protein